MMISWFVLAGNEKGLLSKRQKLFEVFGNGRVLLLNKCTVYVPSVCSYRNKAKSSNFGSPKVHFKNKRCEAKVWHFAFFTVCLVGN